MFRNELSLRPHVNSIFCTLNTKNSTSSANRYPKSRKCIVKQIFSVVRTRAPPSSPLNLTVDDRPWLYADKDCLLLGPLLIDTVKHLSVNVMDSFQFK
jgi:hypothetical protein